MKSGAGRCEGIRRWMTVILGVFILLQPVFDILTSLGVHAGHTLTVGTVVRPVFMAAAVFYLVFLSRFQEKRQCLMVLGALLLYLLVFLAHLFFQGGLSLCLANIRELVKVYFAPFVALFLFAVYRENGSRVPNWAIAGAGALYAGTILLAFLTGTSGTSYLNSGYGFKGWFYAANEVSDILALTVPVVLCTCLTQLCKCRGKGWWKGGPVALVLVSVVFSTTYLGTKVVFGISLLYCVAAAVWCAVNLVRARTRMHIVGTVLFSALTLSIAVSYFSSPLMSYLENVYVPTVDEDVSHNRPGESDEEEPWDEVFDPDGVLLLELIEHSRVVRTVDSVLSHRLTTAAYSVQEYLESGIGAKLLGIGYANAPGYTHDVEKMIEVDPLALLVRQGVVGFAMYYLPYLGFILYVVVSFFRKPGKRMSSLVYCSYLYPTLVAAGISVVAGHALVTPSVSIFVLAISSNLWIMTREQDALQAQ